MFAKYAKFLELKGAGDKRFSERLKVPNLSVRLCYIGFNSPPNCIKKHSRIPTFHCIKQTWCCVSYFVQNKPSPSNCYAYIATNPTLCLTQEYVTTKQYTTAMCMSFNYICAQLIIPMAS